MTKIAILHASNSLNYGTMMMVSNFIYYLGASYEEKIEFYIDNDEEAGLDRIKKSTKYNNIFRLSSVGVFNRPTKDSDNYLIKVAKYLWHVYSYGRNFKKAGITNVIVLGGDDFSEYYPFVGVFIEFLKLKSIKNQNIDVFLVGQTIGPFSRWRKVLAQYFLKDIPIYTRDSQNYNYLFDELGLKLLNQSKDIAFLDLPLQKSGSTAKIQIPKNKYIVIVVSGIWYSYTNDKSAYLKTWTTIISELSKKYKIVLLAHVLTERSSDKKLIDEIFGNLTEDTLQSTIRYTDTLMPFEARELLGNSYFSITGRMHAAVSTYQTLKPSISLSYSIKYSGVIGELNRSDLIIESKGDSKWQDGYIALETLKKVEYLETNYSRISNEIRKMIPGVQEKVMSMIKDIARKI